LLVLLLLLAMLGLVGAYLYSAAGADRELQAAIADAERLAPPWRLEDVESARAVIPDARNSALAVTAAKRLLPPRWPAWEWSPPGEDPNGAPGVRRAALRESLQVLHPQQPLTEEQVAALRTELARVAPALAEARKLAELPEGRYPIRYAPDYIGTLSPHDQDVRQIASLLACDALLRTQEGDADGALASCRAILNAGRSIGDEPLSVPQMVRSACPSFAVTKAQRVLAQGAPSEAALLQLQQLFEKEEAVPIMLIVARGERAGWDRFAEAFLAGQVKLSTLALAARLHSEDELGEAEWLALRTRRSVVAQRAALLRYMNRAVEIARLPCEQQVPRFEQWEESAKDQPLLVRSLAPKLIKIAEGYQLSRAELRCAIVAIAAERYRRAGGRWPDSLEALQGAGYLREVPTDLYDGRPLRMRRLEDGLVVYSVGPDGQDNGGRLDHRNVRAPGTDLGFRLWDAARRRRGPL
jgi:hypothetical protein